jgi:heme exporter protein D
MNWGSVSAFLAMGGYGGFVWGSYAVAVICIVLEIALLAARHRKLRRELHDH